MGATLWKLLTSLRNQTVSNYTLNSLYILCVVEFILYTAPPFPSNVTVLRSDDGREILVSWTPLTLVEAKSLIQFYRVTFDPVSVSRKRQSGATCSQSPCDVPGAEISVMITGLDPSTSYVVQVFVVNGGGSEGPVLW